MAKAIVTLALALAVSTRPPFLTNRKGQIDLVAAAAASRSELTSSHEENCSYPGLGSKRR